MEYTYDVYDRRIRKVVDLDGDGVEAATTENFVYDGEHIALVFDENENLTHRYLHGPNIDQVLAEETADGEVRWALADNQGTVRDVVDSDGVLLNHITYDSFGQITGQSDDAESFRFGYTGREFDEESGQYFYRARYYDATIGRFVNEDTIGFAGGDANLYRYVGNSPLNYTDPSGNNPLSRGWNWIGNKFNDTLTNPIVHTALDKADEFAAGFSDITTFGATTKIRESAYYSGVATRNHEGGVYRAGQVGGFIASVAVGASAPTQLTAAKGAQAITGAQRFAQAHTVIGTGVGAYQSTRNIIEGCATPFDALSFAPLIGYGSTKVVQKITPHLPKLPTKVSGFFDDVRGTNKEIDNIGENLVKQTSDLFFPGPKTLLPKEVAEIQNIVDEFGEGIEIVGSRAAGKGRNLNTNFPAGKGNATSTEWLK